MFCYHKYMIVKCSHQRAPDYHNNKSVIIDYSFDVLQAHFSQE